MGVLLYENAMQVVPLMLVALFLDVGDPQDLRGEGLSPRVAWWTRAQDKAFVLLSGATFIVSLLVVGGGVPPTRLTDGVVIATLGVAIGLLLARVWRRLVQRDP